ncbi:hypothetical protein LSCM1_08116 [Leishmania martiniquensis]|uniref:non-specific serine/threonine protein kinase n=1 Tax=Leishmania martiniquensis TaxID=1580590 RepID=A0A836I3K4_9TRYP|nr:hypothetical protein LSCM1_08116 [Leishmania martiniquensis]
MLRWATQIFGKLSTGAVATPDAGDVDAGEASAHQQQRPHPSYGTDIPPLKRWWSSMSADDASNGAVRSSSPVSLTRASAGVDDDYCSPGVLDLEVSRGFAVLDPAAAAPAPAAVVVTRTSGGDSPTASAAPACDDANAVEDFLANVIAGRTDLLRTRLAQEKIEAAAAVARAAAASHGGNNSPIRTRGGEAGVDGSTSRSRTAAVGGAVTRSSTHPRKSSCTAETGTGGPLAGGTATAGLRGGQAALTAASASQPPRQHHSRRDRYVSSAARSLQDYELIAFLGSGTFAEVTLARNKVTGEYFAVKKISKQRVKEEGCVERTFTERQLLAKLHHPFLVRLYQAFQSHTHLYLVLDFAQGGDLYYLNVQQLWLRSMRRSLIKVRYPYYQSTSSTFTSMLTPNTSSSPGASAAAATAASHAQRPQTRASPSPPTSVRSGSAQRTAGPARPPLSPSSPAPPLAEASLDPQPQSPGGGRGTTTTDRNALLALPSVAGGVEANTASGGAARSGIATGAALPLISAQDGDRGSGADGADGDDGEADGADVAAFGGATDTNRSMTEVSSSLAVWRQQKGVQQQWGVGNDPSQSVRLPTDLTYYTTDAVDEFANSNNIARDSAAALDKLASGSGGSRSSVAVLITPHTPEGASPAAATATQATGASTPATALDEAAAFSATPAASSGHERYRRRRRTLPTAERGVGGARGGCSAGSSSTSSADDDGGGNRRRGAAAEVGRGSSAETALQPSRRPRGVAALKGPAGQADTAAQPLPSPSAPAHRCRSASSGARGARSARHRMPFSFASTPAPLRRSPAPSPHNERSRSRGKSSNDSGGAGDPRQDGKPTLTVSPRSTPSPMEAKRRRSRRASPPEAADAFAAPTSPSARTVTVVPVTGTTNLQEASESVSPSTAPAAEQQQQPASGSSHIATRATKAVPSVRGREKKPLSRRPKAKGGISRGRGAAEGAPAPSLTPPPPPRVSRDRNSRRAPEKKTLESPETVEFSTEQRSFPADAVTLSSASAMAKSFAGVTAAQSAAATAAALRVDLSAPFHQVAMEGSTSVLRTLLRTVFAPDEEHRFPLRLIAFYAIEVAIVLQYLHGEGFLYRDLKPENILMRSDGHVMLTDFGVAKYRKGAVIVSSASGDGVKGGDTGSPSPPGGGTDGRANSFTGTTQYMSPEMLRGQPHDSRTDWWSYGCLLFEWANGRKAFDAPNQFALFRSIVEEDVKITAEDYRLTPLEVHTRVAQLHYRAEEVRLEFEDRVARRLQQSSAPSTLTAEVFYNPDTRSFEVRLRSPAAKGVEQALAGDSARSGAPLQQSSCDYSPPPSQPSEGAMTKAVLQQRDHSHVHSHSYASPCSTLAAATASAAVTSHNSFASDFGTQNPTRAASAEGDTPGLLPQSPPNDSFAGMGSNSLRSRRDAPTNLSMRLTTTDGGTIAALLSSASPAALQQQQQDDEQQQEQERRLRHQRRRQRLSCLTLDEATRDRYISNAVTQMEEAQALLRDLTVKLLDRRVEHRLSGEAVLEHPFFTCPYVVSQLYYDVYQRRVLSAEMRRSVRAVVDSNTSLADPVASVTDEPLQQAASQLLLQGSSPAAAAAASRIHTSFEAISLPSQTRPEDWRELFMERRIRAPYAPRLRTRDDLRYFPAAVTATGLSAAAEQQRRIKEVKEQHKELMMMRASKAAAAPTNSSFSAATFTASLAGPHTQRLVSGSGSASGGGGPVVLVPLDTEAAQHVQQLIVASSRSSSMCYNDGAEPALAAAHAAAAPVALASPAAGSAVASAQHQSALSTSSGSSQGLTEKPQPLQLPSVEVTTAALVLLRGAVALPKRPAEVPEQSSAARDAREAVAAEDSQLGSPAPTQSAVAVAAMGVRAPSPAALAATRAEMTVTESATEVAPPPNAAETAAAVGECRRDLFGRAATLPQSFVDAALAVTAVAQKRHHQRSSGPVTASTASTTTPSETRRGNSVVMAAAAELSCTPAPTDGRRLLGANRSNLAATSSTSLSNPPLEEHSQQQQQKEEEEAVAAVRASGARHHCSAPSERRERGCAADSRQSRALSAGHGVEGLRVGGEEAHAYVMEDEAEDEDRDGGGGYYEQDALAEDDAHVVDGGDDAAAVNEAAGTVDMATTSDGTTAAVMASTADARSCDGAPMDAKTRTQQGTSLSASGMLSSISRSGWRGGSAVPLCVGGGAGSDNDVDNYGDGGRGGALVSGPLSTGRIEPPPVVVISPTLSSQARSLLGSSAAPPLHGPAKEIPAYTSPLQEPTTPLSHSGEMHCDLSAFATSSVSSMLTVPFDDSQRSLSASLGTSAPGGLYTNSSTRVTSSSADTLIPVREHQRRALHHLHHHPLSYTNADESHDVFDAAPRVLPLPPSLALDEQRQRQPLQKPLPPAVPAESDSLPGTTSPSSHATTVRSVAGMMRPGELTGVGDFSGIAAIAAHTTMGATVSAEAAGELAAALVGTTSVGDVGGSPPGGSCHEVLRGADAARSGAPQMPAPFPSLKDRGGESSRASVTAVTGLGSGNTSYDDADDGHDLGAMDESGYQICSGDDGDGGVETTTGYSSERGDEEESESDASKSCESASRPATPTPPRACGRDDAGNARSAGAELPQLGSSASSISTATSTSMHAFSTSSGAPSVNFANGSDSAAATEADAATARHTLISSPMTVLAGVDRSGAGDLFDSFGPHQDCGGPIFPSSFSAALSLDADIGDGDISRRDPLGATGVAATPSALYRKPTAKAPPPLDCSSGLFSNVFASSASLDTIDGSGAAERFGPLTTTLSGVAYKVDDEASTSALAGTPMVMTGSSDTEGVSTPSLPSYRGLGQGGKDAIGTNTSGGGGGPPGTGDRRGVQAFWAQQQRKRIERELQQRQSQQIDHSEETLAVFGTGAESHRRCNAEGGRRWSYGITHEDSRAATSSKIKLASVASDDGATEEVAGRCHEVADNFGCADQAEPPQRSHGASTQLSLQRRQRHVMDPCQRSVSDDDEGDAGAAGRHNAAPRLLFSSQSGGNDRSVERGHRSSLWSSGDNEGGTEGRASVTSGDGSGGRSGGGGGFDHFQNFSFTSPQILQQYLSASSAGGGVGGCRPPPYQRPRRDRLGGGA